MENNVISLEQAITEIVRTFPRGCIFDAHTVINALRTKHYNELYMQAYVPDVKTYHSHISSLICKIVENEGLVEKQTFKSYSHNIYGRISPCKAWRKV